MDGVNDIFAALRFPQKEDGYSAAGLGDEFDGLTNPESMSLRLMGTTWLFNHSALYRSARESLARRNRIRARTELARLASASLHPDVGRLSSNERQQIEVAVGRLSNYVHTVQQIHELAKLDGTQVVFVLQPQIALTRKRLTGIEARLFEYWSKMDGPLEVYGFQTLYPLLSSRLTNDAATKEYHFLDLSNVFDQTNVQVFTDYCHLTSAGNQMVANAIFDSFAASLWQLSADARR